MSQDWHCLLFYHHKIIVSNDKSNMLELTHIDSFFDGWWTLLWKPSSAIINSNNQKRISQTRYRKYLISYKSKKQVNGIEINMTIYNQKATETPRRNARGRLLFILFLIMLIKLSCFFHLRVNISERQKCQTLIVIQRVLYIPFALEQKIVVLMKILHPFALE